MTLQFQAAVSQVISLKAKPAKVVTSQTSMITKDITQSYLSISRDQTLKRQISQTQRVISPIQSKRSLIPRAHLISNQSLPRRLSLKSSRLLIRSLITDPLLRQTGLSGCHNILERPLEKPNLRKLRSCLNQAQILFKSLKINLRRC